MFLEEFNIKLNSIPKTQKLLLENITKIVTKEEEMLALLTISGPPRVFLNLVCDNVPLIDRYKTITGAGDEMSDEQRDEYMKTNFDFPKKIIDILNNQCIKKIDINSNNSEPKTFNIIENILGKKFVVINHDYNMHLENTLYHIATTHKILYINVPALIKREIDLETEWAEKLNNSYNIKKLWSSSEQKRWSQDELIYYTYNPIHYDNNVVNALINQYVIQNGKENEGQRNIVILTGYFNNGLLSNKDQSLNLPILEVKQLLGLGI